MSTISILVKMWLDLIRATAVLLRWACRNYNSLLTYSALDLIVRWTAAWSLAIIITVVALVCRCYLKIIPDTSHRVIVWWYIYCALIHFWHLLLIGIKVLLLILSHKHLTIDHSGIWKADPTITHSGISILRMLLLLKLLLLPVSNLDLSNCSVYL